MGLRSSTQIALNNSASTIVMRSCNSFSYVSLLIQCFVDTYKYISNINIQTASTAYNAFTTAITFKIMHRFRISYSRFPSTIRRITAELPHESSAPVVQNLEQQEEIQTSTTDANRYQLSASNPFAIFENPEYHLGEEPAIDQQRDLGGVVSLMTRVVRWMKIKIFGGLL
jgi:hypothetical protein